MFLVLNRYSVFILDGFLGTQMLYPSIRSEAFLLWQLIVVFVILVTWSSAEVLDMPHYGASLRCGAVTTGSRNPTRRLKHGDRASETCVEGEVRQQ
jgi:hypothetical protein